MQHVEDTALPRQRVVSKRTLFLSSMISSLNLHEEKLCHCLKPKYKITLLQSTVED